MAGMRKSRFLPGMLLLSLALPLPAQEKESELPKLVEQMDVRVINVDVIVTDKKGNRVSGLTKDDFELVENGVTLPISNFFEAAPTTETVPLEMRPTAQQARRHIVVFIDQVSVEPANRNRVIKYLRTFLDRAIRDNDEVMIATYHRRLDIRMPFTDNREAVMKTLDLIQSDPGGGIDLAHGRRDAEMAIKNADLPLQRLLIARTYAMNAEQRLTGTIEAIMHLMSVVAGVEGKKVLMMVGESLPMQPGHEVLSLLDRFDSKKNPFDTAGSEIGVDEEQTDSDALTVPTQFNDLFSSAYGARQHIDEIARTANANGITLYPIHAGGIPGGVDTVAEYGSAGPDMVGFAESAMRDTAEAMRYIADRTGGAAIVGANHFEYGLDNIQKDLQSYYSLGYRPSDTAAVKERKIRVQAKNRAYTVRSRQQVIDKTTTQTMGDEVLANLLSVQKPNDLGLVMSIEQPVPAGRGNYRVPIKLQIPMNTLTLIPRGDLHMGAFEIFAVLGSAKNAVSKVVRLPHHLTLDQTQFSKLEGKFYTYSVDIMMRGGTNQLSVAVVDQVSGTQGFGRATVATQ